MARLLGDNENFRLSQLINLMYKYDSNFDKVKYLSTYTLRKDYYEWLMDIDGFDYGKFDAYWILHYQTSHYYKAFKKSRVLKKALQKQLKKRFMEGVAKAYFDIY